MPLMDGPRQKLRRAYEHLDTLDREAEPLETHLSTEAIKKDIETETGDYVWRIRFDEAEVESFLQRVSVLAGDAIHNLRSSLDHVVWTLSTADKERCEFPIFLKPEGRDGFHKGSVQKFGSIPMEAKTLIEGIQPYQRPCYRDDPKYSELWAIHDLDRIDKHRRLVIAVAQLQGAIYGCESLNLRYRPLKNGNEVARLPFAAREAGEDCDPQFIIRVVIKETPPLLATISARSQLRDLASFVQASVIEPIEQL